MDLETLARKAAKLRPNGTAQTRAGVKLTPMLPIVHGLRLRRLSWREIADFLRAEAGWGGSVPTLRQMYASWRREQEKT